MIFETATLGASLRPYIDSILYFKGFMPEHAIERVVPTGQGFLIFELDGIERHMFDNATLEPQQTYAESWISGVQRGYISISAHQDSEMLVVQFKSTGAAPFLHVDMGLLQDRVLAAHECLGPEVVALRKQLVQGANAIQKLERAMAWLHGRLDESRAAPAPLQAVIERIANHPTRDLDDAMHGYPHTPKHLIAQFKRFVGTTPKTYHRIVRFNAVLARINQAQKLTWADVAALSGFSDQSHFIKEFRAFSGFNPTEFAKLDLGDHSENFFPLDAKG
ncbi:MAG: helix-turn-helix domain-containing protein [Nannocystaceae bacterium]